jgi:hypothetical protein
VVFGSVYGPIPYGIKEHVQDRRGQLIRRGGAGSGAGVGGSAMASIVDGASWALSRVMWKAVLGLHYERKKQKEEGQLAIF